MSISYYANWYDRDPLAYFVKFLRGLRCNVQRVLTNIGVVVSMGAIYILEEL